MFFWEEGEGVGVPCYCFFPHFYQIGLWIFKWVFCAIFHFSFSSLVVFFICMSLIFVAFHNRLLFCLYSFICFCKIFIVLNWKYGEVSFPFFIVQYFANNCVSVITGA